MTSSRTTLPVHGPRRWILALSLAAAGACANASEFTVLHSFSVSDGYYPRSTLAIDAQGNLYGSTPIGGGKGEGTLFRIGAGGFSTLHAFDFDDGSGPEGALMLDADGNLWGTASQGGRFGGGTAYRLDPSGQLRYASIKDGSYPFAGLTRGPDGALYGVTSTGGDKRGQGTVFRLDPASFALTTLHEFRGQQGTSPQGALLSTGGMLVGTTFEGGRGDRGTVFELLPDGSGFSAERAARGGWLQSGLTLDAQGHAFGVASVNKPLPGDSGRGSGGIYTIDADGQVTLVHPFAHDGSEGAISAGELLLAQDGWLYGMTTLDGAFGHGTLYRFNPADDTLEVLHDFSGKANDGSEPYSGLSQDATGAFYGVTTEGGANGVGVAFRFVP